MTQFEDTIYGKDMHLACEDIAGRITGKHMTYKDYISSILYTVTVLVAVAIVAWRMPRRTHFGLRCTLCSLAMFVYISLATFIIGITQDNEMYDALIWFHSVKFFIAFILSGICVHICVDCDWWVTLHCATAGYCIQHISARLDTIVQDTAFQGAEWIYSELISLAIAAVVFIVVYRIALRKAPKGLCPIIAKKPQLLLALCMVAVCVFYNSFGISYAETLIYSGMAEEYVYIGHSMLAFVCITSALIALLTLMLDFSCCSSEMLVQERNTLQQLLEEKRIQYESEKENIEQINIKCHDIKHQIASMNQTVSMNAAVQSGASGAILETQLNELSENISIYDTSLETGNSALDVVMWQKILLCRNTDIRLTCMLDGRKLSFMPEHEVYTLFCNALDNAIEGVSSLPEDKRVISVSERIEKGMYIVRVENYFSGTINVKDGKGSMPVTSKKGSGHGLGMKSMKMIVESHGGQMKYAVHDELFVLEMSFPESVICISSSISGPGTPVWPAGHSDAEQSAAQSVL